MKFVHWYDLQVELVDHLANKIIEAEWPLIKPTFERALENVYVFSGFSVLSKKIVSEKQEALRKAQ
jgi:hypothetical protein